MFRKDNVLVGKYSHATNICQINLLIDCSKGISLNNLRIREYIQPHNDHRSTNNRQI